MRTHAEVVKGIEGFVEQIQRLRDQARGVPDEVLIALVGNTVTEEALQRIVETTVSNIPHFFRDTPSNLVTLNVRKA